MIGFFEMGFAWQTFERLEKRLEESLYYVPLDEPHVYNWSPFYREMLIQTGSEIDSFFRNMIDSKSLDKFPDVTALRNKRENLDISNYRKAFEPIFKLSSVEIDVYSPNLHYDIIKPFVEFANIEGIKTPQWWVEHQNIKHDWANNYQKAHLRNVVEGLSGLFALNILHKECQNYLVDKEVIRSTEPDFLMRENPENIMAILQQSFVGFPAHYTYGIGAKSKLFYHDFRRDEKAY